MIDSEIWPLPEEDVLRTIEERPRTPTMTIRTRKRHPKHNSARRGGARRGHITRLDVRNCFYEEGQDADAERLHDNEAPHGVQDHPQNVQQETEEVESKQRSPKRRRIGRRELKSLEGGSSEDAELEGRSRDRKPPQRYGFGEEL